MDGAHGVLHPARHLAGHGAAGGRQRHVDGDVPLIGNVHAVDQAELIDVGRDFRIIDCLERGYDVVRQAVDILGRKRSGRRDGRSVGLISAVSVTAITSRKQALGFGQGFCKLIDFLDGVIEAK